MPETSRVRKFLSIILTQLFTVFNLDIVRNILFGTLIYNNLESGNLSFLITSIVATFFLPYFLFSATAGQICDKYDKARIIRITKLIEIICLPCFWYGIRNENPYILVAVIFIMGVQSVFFTIAKHSIVQNQFKKDELLGINILLDCCNYFVIIFTSLVGYMISAFEVDQNTLFCVLFGMLILSYLTSFTIFKSKNDGNKRLSINKDFLGETKKSLKRLFKNSEILSCSLGVAWSAFILYLFIAEIPTLITSSPSISFCFIILFLAGCAIGSLLTMKLLKNTIQATYIPFGLLGMTLMSVILYFFMKNQYIPMMTVDTLFTFYDSYIIMFSLIFIGVCFGIYTTPLKASVQLLSGRKYSARLISASTFVSSILIIGAILLVNVCKILNVSMFNIILLTGLCNILILFKLSRILPEALIRSFSRLILNSFFNIKIKGMENYFKAGKKVIIIANHTSLLDAVLLASFLPENVLFTINTYVAKKWWVKPFLKLVDVLPVDVANPLAVKTIIEQINKNKKCLIFPEGRITTTGALMKIYEGTGLIADKTDAMILPIRIKGAQYSKFSYLKDKEKTHWFPKISIKILPPRKFHIDDDVKGRSRREDISTKIYDLMTEMIFKSSNIQYNLFRSLVNAKSVFGGSFKVIEDTKREPWTYNKFIKKSYILGEVIKEKIKDERIGIMIFNSIEPMNIFFALQAVDKTPAMINFTGGLNGVLSACVAGDIKTIITSHLFINTLELFSLEEKLIENGINLVYYEDLKAGFKANFVGRLKNMIKFMPKKENDDPAVILFTSGSEGKPKGVVLSHRNLQANRYQFLSILALDSKDIFFTCLPIFHSFGLNTATLTPLLSGCKLFLYPSPLKYRVVPELSYDINASVIFGTDTFFSGYAKMGHQYDFHRIKYAIGGAEKIKDSTRMAWMFKFGVRILEGYGATETAPIITINTPMYTKAGSVGRVLPGIEFKIEKVENIEHGGALVVKGDNVMLGYMKYDKPGVLQPLEDGWYNTGDIVDIDEDGFVTISGRLKRFAKIAGEMVSLGAIEFAVNSLWEGYLQCIVVIPDDKKGEQLVLLTQKEDANLNDLIEYFHKNGFSDLWIPKKIVIVEEFPVLGSGKVDFAKAKTIVEEKLLKK